MVTQLTLFVYQPFYVSKDDLHEIRF